MIPWVTKKIVIFSVTRLVVCLLGMVSVGTLLSSLPAGAQDHAQAVANAEASLNRISTAVGRFLQISNEGNVARGDFFLSRPGRLLFDYDPPSALILLADGRNVIEIDTDLQSARRRALSQTPLRLFLNENVNFRESVNVSKVEKIADSLLITMQDEKRPQDGIVTLVIDAKNYTLRAWQVVDNKGERTTVRLENMTYGVNIPGSYFKDPGY